MNILKYIVNWYLLKEARWAANKYNLDFVHRCAFREQIIGIGKGIRYGNGEISEVPMQSGKIALYKVTSERYNVMSSDTGQKNWYFKFQGYLDS